MKKLIALLLVFCMVAGLFVACKKSPVQVKDPTAVSTESTKAPETTEAPAESEATESADATKSTDAAGEPDATEETEAPEGEEEPEETEATEGEEEPEETEATEGEEEPEETEETKNNATENPAKPTVKPVQKPTVKPTVGNKVTKATKDSEATKEATKETESTKSTKATEATKEATKATKPVATKATKPGATKATEATKEATKSTKPAATKTTEATKSTEPTKATEATKEPAATNPGNSDASSFKGKTLQIYGLGSGTEYTNYKEFGNGNYLWMMRAAIEEWATEQGVTVEYEGSYDQNRVISAINSGEKPDIIFQTGNFPAISNVGLTSAFTEDEVKKLAEICGTDKYFTMMTYKEESHGFVFPWSGVSMLYYNKSMFEEYGVKTPKEYFEEGNWNWTTFQECLEGTTQDVDSDGKVDTYGIAADSLSGGGLYYSLLEDDKGNLISRMDEQITTDYYALAYEQGTVNKTIQRPGKRNIQTNVIYPMVAMQIGDCEPYNFEHLYQSIANGNELEAVPVPVYDGKDGKEQITLWTDSCGSLAKSCDERAAAIDLISYLLKVGLKYISDYSLGTVKCDYPGMKGSCDLSYQWLVAFTKVCNKRASAIQKIDGYDADFVTKINEYLENGTHYVRRKYDNVSDLTTYSEIYEMPPESSIPAVRGKYQNMLDVYNKLYIQ